VDPNNEEEVGPNPDPKALVLDYENNPPYELEVKALLLISSRTYEDVALPNRPILVEGLSVG
jgi:hypothetical protein